MKKNNSAARQYFQAFYRGNRLLFAEHNVGDTGIVMAVMHQFMHASHDEFFAGKVQQPVISVVGIDISALIVENV